MSESQKVDWASLPGRLEALDRQRRSAVLARLAHELTVLARCTYEPGTAAILEPKRLRGINEIMHRVTYRLVKLIRGDEDEWPESFFWQVLTEMSRQSDCIDDLELATSSAIAAVTNKTT